MPGATVWTGNLTIEEARSFRLLDSVETTMRDGCVLRADLWLPDGDGPWPVILQRTPYRKEDAFGTHYISALDFRAALRRGYAIAIQDTRGRYTSEGAFEPFVHEREDGADTIAWLRSQPFCNGEVVMFGASYVGATQVLAASGRPEGLIAVSPHLTTARHGETWTWRHGAAELGFLMLWIIESLGPADIERALADPASAALAEKRDVLAGLRADPAAAFERLPVFDAAIEVLAPYARRWFDAAAARAAANDREHLDALARGTLPFLVSCGWNDLFLEGSIELFETVRRRWARAEDVRDRLIIGPWSHGNPSDWQGDFWLGYAAATAGLSDEQLDFFDAARKSETPRTPMVRYFRSGSNSWHAASDWPLPGTRSLSLFLDGEALADMPAIGEWSRAFLSDTLDPVPTVGGASFVPGLLQGRNSGPKDQAGVERRDDVLLFTSAPLDADLEVTGLVEALLVVSATGASADWTARLCDVDPSGRSIGLVDGICRLPANDTPGSVALRIGHVSHLFQKGHRIRLQVASSNFPRFDRNPQSDVAAGRATAADFIVATHRLHGGGAGQSRLVLPIVPAQHQTISSFVDG